MRGVGAMLVSFLPACSVLTEWHETCDRATAMITIDGRFASGALASECMFTRVRRVLRWVVGGAVLVGCASSAPAPAPGPPVVVAHAEPPPGYRVLLVAYPRTACSGSARTVLMDERGTYFGAVGPGEASLITLPVGMRTIVAVSAVEIVAPPRTHFPYDEIDVPPAPSAVLLESTRVSARQCSKTGQYASATSVSKHEIEERLADAEITWLEPQLREGQAWLDEHRARVDEMRASLAAVGRRDGAR